MLMWISTSCLFIPYFCGWQRRGRVGCQTNSTWACRMEGHLLLNSLSVLSYCAQSKTGNLTAPEILYQYCTALSCLQLNLSTACVWVCTRMLQKPDCNLSLSEFIKSALKGVQLGFIAGPRFCHEIKANALQPVNSIPSARRFPAALNAAR